LEAEVALVHETDAQEVPNDELKVYDAALKSRGSLFIWLDRTMDWYG